MRQPLIMRMRTHRDRDSNDLVNGQQLLGERTIHRPDRWQVEQAVDGHRRRIGCRCDPAEKHLRDHETVEQVVRDVGGKLLDRRNISGQRRRRVSPAIEDADEDDRDQHRAV
jgi:hypothetical protein